MSEQMESFTRMALPVEFDANSIKNSILNVRYGPLPEHQLDIFYPDVMPEKPMPVIFYIHGGGWIMGSRRFGALTCIIDAIKSGYAVITVDYRLAPGAAYPEFLFDVKTAIRFARANAEKYNFDPTKFGAIGDSAGGHIVDMLALTGDYPELAGYKYGYEGVSDSVQAVVSLYGPAVLDHDDDKWCEENGKKRFDMRSENGLTMYQEAFSTDNKSLLRLISPISYVHKGIAPIMFRHGNCDVVVPWVHSKMLADKIIEVCGADDVVLDVVDGCEHSDKLFVGSENCVEALKFFDKYLK